MKSARHDALCDAGRRPLDGLLTIVPSQSGLHTIGRLPSRASEVAIVDGAQRRDLSVSPLGRFALTRIPARALVLGFGGIAPRQIEWGAGRAGRGAWSGTLLYITLVIRYPEDMTKVLSRLTAQGQVSVPAEVRKKLGLAPGSILEWREEQGEYVVRRAGRHTSEEIHEALFPKPPKPATLAELTAGIRQHVKRKHARR